MSLSLLLLSRAMNPLFSVYQKSSSQEERDLQNVNDLDEVLVMIVQK